jgi:hypothetical protein
VAFRSGHASQERIVTQKTRLFLTDGNLNPVSNFKDCHFDSLKVLYRIAWRRNHFDHFDGP